MILAFLGIFGIHYVEIRSHPTACHWMHWSVYAASNDRRQHCTCNNYTLVHNGNPDPVEKVLTNQTDFFGQIQHKITSDTIGVGRKQCRRRVSISVGSSRNDTTSSSGNFELLNQRVKLKIQLLENKLGQFSACDEIFQVGL